MWAKPTFWAKPPKGIGGQNTKGYFGILWAKPPKDILQPN